MNYSIRYADPSEVDLLNEIEQSASELFTGTRHKVELEGECLMPEFLLARIADSCLWVAADDKDIPVAFAAMAIEAGNAHLHELSVARDHMRRGLGRRLVETVIDAARERGYTRLTLSTFDDVAWNAPFYHRLGFEKLDPAEYHDDHKRLRAIESNAGLDLDSRIIMFSDL